MSWQDDPEFQAARRLHQVRSGLLRTAIIWTPLFALALFGFVFYLVDTATGGHHGGTWVLVVILGLFALLFGFQAIQAILDLAGAPKQQTGVVQRRWARRDSFILQSHYMRLDGRILRGDRFILDEVHERDYVQVTFYSHSNIIVSVEKLPPPSSTS